MRIAFSSSQVNVPARLPPGQADSGLTGPSSDGEPEAIASFRAPPQELPRRSDGQVTVPKPPMDLPPRSAGDPRGSAQGSLAMRSLGGPAPPRALPPGPSPSSQVEVVTEPTSGPAQPVYVVLQWNVQLPGQLISGQTAPTWVQGDFDPHGQGATAQGPPPQVSREGPPPPPPMRVPTNVPLAEFVGQAFVAVDDCARGSVHESERERTREANVSTTCARASYRRSPSGDAAPAADAPGRRKERIVAQG